MITRMRMRDISSFFEFKGRTCSFGKKAKLTNRFIYKKIFLFYDDNVNQLN